VASVPSLVILPASVFEIIVCKNRQTDRQTDRQTNTQMPPNTVATRLPSAWVTILFMFKQFNTNIDYTYPTTKTAKITFGQFVLENYTGQYPSTQELPDRCPNTLKARTHHRN